MRYLIAFLFPLYTLAQSGTDYGELDRSSYEQYLKNDFAGLKKSMRSAKRNEISFYYLHMRAGIVAWNHKNYDYAIPQFRRALEMNPMDTLAQQYLYYALLYSGQSQEAILFAKSLPEDFLYKINHQEKKTDYIRVGLSYIGAGSDNTPQISKGYTKSTYINSGITNLQFNSAHSLSDRWKLNTGFSYFGNGGEHLTSSDTGTSSNDYSSRSLQLNLGVSYYRRRWHFYQTFSFYRTSFTEYLSMRDFRGQLREIPVDTTWHAFATTSGVSRRFRYFYISQNITLSSFDQKAQFQTQSSICIFPFGNQKFYTNTALTYIKNQQPDHWVFSQAVGIQINPSILLNASYTRGSMQYYSTNYGFTNYYTADPVSREMGISATFKFKKMEFSPGIYSQKRSQYSILSNTSGENIEKINYKNTLLNFNLKWNF